MKLSKIKPNPNNPRIVKDDKFKKLVKSIKEFPKMMELRPMVIDSEGIVLGGNMRLKALKELGYKDIPKEWVKFAKDLTDEEKKRFIIADNVGFGLWDWEQLANEWDEEQLIDWGLDIPDFEEEDLEAVEDDYSEPEQMQVDVVEGDLIEFVCQDGRVHRLLCGDSTSTTDLGKLMQGKKADLAHNDPPYGMKKEKEGVLNDNLNYADLLDFNKEWIAIQFTHLKDNGSWYCWGIDQPLMDIYNNILKPYFAEQKATFRNLITWDKGNGQGQMAEEFRSYPVADEKCLFVMMGVQGFNTNQDNYFEDFEPIRQYLEKEIKKIGENDKKIANAIGHKDGRTVNHWWSTSQWCFPIKDNYNALKHYASTKDIDVFKKEYDEIKKEYDEIKKEWYNTRAFFNNTHDNMNNVWHFARHNRTGNEGGHATPKPIPLCDRVIKSSCPANGIVLDCFLGSGSTMVAAHQLKRTCYGCELDTKYCQVIIDRMTKLDETLTVKINGKEYKKEAEKVPF